MSFKKIAGVIGGSFVLLVILAGIFGSSSNNKNSNTSPTPAPEVKSASVEATLPPVPTTDPNRFKAKVILVIDGDTVELEGGQRLRLIGIDTPETVDPNRPVGCYGKEASNFTMGQLEGKEVELEKDVSETDKYGRLLRYVWLGDSLFNEVLVKEGYAQSSTFPPDVKYQDKFLAAQTEARNAKKGLWGAVCQTPTSKPVTQPSSVPTVGGNCKYSCTNPDRDCSDFSTHSEAQSFFNCCGFSATNDPMRLDKATGTGNGLACESLP